MIKYKITVLNTNYNYTYYTYDWRFLNNNPETQIIVFDDINKNNKEVCVPVSKTIIEEESKITETKDHIDISAKQQDFSHETRKEYVQLGPDYKDIPPFPVIEKTTFPSGIIVVLAGNEESGIDSFWFDKNGKSLKGSYLSYDETPSHLKQQEK